MPRRKRRAAATRPDPSPDGDIREALPADRRRAIASLADAFRDDPAMQFMFPVDRGRAKRLPRLFSLLYDSDAGNLRLVSPDVAAVTLWRRPGAARNDGQFGWHDKLRALWVFGFALPRAKLLGEAIEAHFPPTPFWYLHIAGCARAAQGRGLGAAAVRAGLSQATDAPTYLETANEDNLGFYGSLGFEVTERWQVSEGPVFWSMMRPI